MKKDILLIEFFKREGLEYLRQYTETPYEKIITKKFKKNEIFDKEAISYLKKIDIKLSKQLTNLMLERENFNKNIIDKISALPIYDEIVQFLDQNFA